MMFIFSFYQNVKSPYTRIAYMHSPPTSTAYTRFLSHIPDAKIHPYGLIDNRLASLNLIHEALFRHMRKRKQQNAAIMAKDFCKNDTAKQPKKERFPAIQTSTYPHFPRNNRPNTDFYEENFFSFD